MIEQFKKELKIYLEKHLNLDNLIIEEPKKGNADLAIPLFAYAKLWQTNPMAVFEKFKSVLESNEKLSKIEFMNGFLNMYLNRDLFARPLIETILKENETYGFVNVGHNETVVMDYSSPNIAKSFGVGHLRSTMIGNALKNIYKKSGYNVVAVNHLGDWGTQFGKMIVAYTLWGNDDEIKQNPIAELQKLYVRFHDAEKEDPTLEDKAREVFKALEEGNQTYFKLWQWFKEESLSEFMEMYDLLGVSFDSFNGEAFYNDKMDVVVKELEDKGLLKVDEGATIVELPNDLPPALIKKSDGATLYITRDLAAIMYRHKTYHTNRILYVVGNEQQLHFKQLKAVTDLMGYNFDIEHINFGLVLIDGKKMSTRGGKFKRLEDVIIQAVSDAKAAILEKNPNLKNQDDVAKAVGVGAIIFNDLKNERHLDVDFNLANMLKFEGMTGPYLQYSSVRIESILKEGMLSDQAIDWSHILEDHYFEVIKLLAQFPTQIERAKDNNAPSQIARYITSVAQAFNSFYGKQRILVEDEGHKQLNLHFIKAIQIVINEGLRILGITPLKEM
ncbi:MAG: arginine--tRNA ligase [Tenericutes bacterium GWC2_34_14]|nr:MAG: arginine--tRNA ligase [Tenericutes bacterium GWC2_34_14]OHE34427.1 MAG: arginine--tRNA ligase [Tenericutes bacterium GWE2_34_108]OHE35783.1 MAG: arginine--tRNA ligase [Tenericutes bacterium GWF1_35_14]OHE39130.1 MAG: arginine--tRNA ligase [Tenericutes bacterium GWF2_35_184]OHE42803.1 MAG: arginine--tRNA ligase [Tenericutes bacterium RIFOXYA2_FULL_36_32]OHE46031.1 MAG: arginine--tRNA ligase [Tenericutes bacterium RIFOXYB2_FULL_36_25]OHE49986.1 MAG: arginine--tRNA ligase [Tenericutes ba